METKRAFNLIKERYKSEKTNGNLSRSYAWPIRKGKLYLAPCIFTKVLIATWIVDFST